MVGPNTEAHEPYRDRSGDHHGVSEDRFAGKNRNDFGRERECRNDENINFRMTEDPEEVHPKGGRTASLRIKKMSAEVTVYREHHLSGREGGYGQDDQSRHDEIHPG